MITYTQSCVLAWTSVPFFPVALVLVLKAMVQFCHDATKAGFVSLGVTLVFLLLAYVFCIPSTL